MLKESTVPFNRRADGSASLELRLGVPCGSVFIPRGGVAQLVRAAES
jgi:hypothetical protein